MTRPGIEPRSPRPLANTTHLVNIFVKLGDFSLALNHVFLPLSLQNQKLKSRNNPILRIYIYIYIYILILIKKSKWNLRRLISKNSYGGKGDWDYKQLTSTTEHLFCFITWKWRCNGYRCRKWTRWHEFKSWTRLIAFYIALIPLGKVWIQLFSLQLWVNSRAD